MQDERIRELEIRMTHLEDFINQLNRIVLENGKVIDSLKIEQASFKQQLNELSEQIPDPGSEKPPHY